MRRQQHRNERTKLALQRGGSRSSQSPLYILGDESQGGTYVLRIHVQDRLEMPFGRFKRAKKIEVLPGDHTYVGSALGRQGATCLARRLVRHASRTDPNPPHPIREVMMQEFPSMGLGEGDLRPARGKHLKWNVDHLLNQPCVDLLSAYLIRSPVRIETAAGKMLEEDAATVVLEKGLGASDVPGNTHLLRVEADDEWWQALPMKLQSVLQVAEAQECAQEVR